MSAASIKDLRNDSYEKQLSDGELRWLHSALLEDAETLDEIKLKAPPWRRGTYEGSQPSRTTLHNIQARLEMEQELANQDLDNEAYAKALAEDLPGISDEDIDRVITRKMIIKAGKENDAAAYAKIRALRDNANFSREKLRLAQAAEARKGQELELAKRRVEMLETKLRQVSDAADQAIAKPEGITADDIKRIQEAAKLL
ncbi:MAG TPA: hypothetical protein VMF06_23235 [Candidatus Limnocylindria bacterium]|jgi:hypothetical protein|nr:hypothetical protein [Candidatus Limnocylindria bacterium]